MISYRIVESYILLGLMSDVANGACFISVLVITK